MTDESAPDAATFARGTPQAVALGLEPHSAGDGKATVRIPFRADLVGDPAAGGLAGGAIVTALDQACGQAISTALRARAEAEGRSLRMGGMATLDFRIDHLRPAGPGLDVTVTTECLGIEGEVAFTRGLAFDADPTDPIAITQGAFMLAGVMVAS
jgi:acyl-coenzyme A thioesterase PaaI-like protein